MAYTSRTSQLDESDECTEHSHDCRKMKVDPQDLLLDTPKVRFVCMSDTHNRAKKFLHEIPDGDIFLFAGDFTNNGNPDEVEKFNDFLGEIKNKFAYIVVLPGNHDISFDDEYLSGKQKHFGYHGEMNEYLEKKGKTRPRELLTNCSHFLMDSQISFKGLDIYGSPWQSDYEHFAFFSEKQQIQKKWDAIPTKIDVLLTHEAPYGYSSTAFGCKSLTDTVRDRVRPMYHVFGHMHKGPCTNGIVTDGKTTFINASCPSRSNHPVIFDIPLPQGCTKP